MESYNLAIKEGLRNFLRGRSLSLAMTGCIAVAVFAVGAFGLLALNISYLLKRWESRVELVAFLEHDLDSAKTKKALQSVGGIAGIEDARLVTGKESWRELFSEVSASINLDKAPLEEVLPASIVIRLTQGVRDIASIRKIASEIASIEGVDEVKFEEMLLERYTELRRDIAMGTTGASIFWILVFGLITINVAGLASAARRHDIKTLRLLGASTKFVRRIFAVEGVAQGVSGSALGILALAVTAMILSSRMGGTLQLPMRMFAAAFFVGPILGLLSNWFLYRNVLSIVIVSLLVTIPDVSHAAVGDALQTELLKNQRELHAIEKELRKSRAKAAKVSEQVTVALDELQEVDKAIDDLAGSIEIGVEKIKNNRVAMEGVQGELELYEGDYTQSRKELEQWLRLLCNKREPTIVEVILNDIPQSKITKQREMIARLAKKEAETLERVQKLRQAVISREDDLRKRLELDTLYTEKAKLRAEQSFEKKKQREALLARLREEKNIYEAVIKDLEVSAGKLEAMIETQREDSQAVFPGSAPFREMKGLLPWPAEGEITLPFGRLRNPKSPTYTRHIGLDIAAPAGSTIRAVHDAVVAYSDWFRGYGKLIILDHGDGYNSVYAHCSQMLVKKGDNVRAGQAIAFVGETGSLKGPFLYFEIRWQGQPEDPAIWLQRRNMNATQAK